MARMHVETTGRDDAADLVLLHGGIGTGRYHWSKPLPQLADSYRVHLPDLPGHGQSPLPEDGGYNREVLVEAVRTLLERFDAPPHVAGFSMGGHTMLALLQGRVDLCASLTLVGVSIRPHAGLDGWREKFDPDRFEEAYPLWARQLSKLHAPLGGPDAWRDVCRRDAAGMDITVDLDALARYEAPVLLVRGDRDPAVDPGHYAQLRRTWPQADEFVVPAGGHDVHLTRRQLVTPALLDFLERAADARGRVPVARGHGMEQ